MIDNYTNALTLVNKLSDIESVVIDCGFSDIISNVFCSNCNRKNDCEKSNMESRANN